MAAPQHGRRGLGSLQCGRRVRGYPAAWREGVWLSCGVVGGHMAVPQRGRRVCASPTWQEGVWLSSGMAGGHVAAPRCGRRGRGSPAAWEEGPWLSRGMAGGRCGCPAAWWKGAWLSRSMALLRPGRRACASLT